MSLSYRQILIAILIFVVASIATLIAPHIERVIAFAAIDDGLYYPIVAENIAKLGQFTYDGISITNGFHPLYLLIILPIFTVISDPWVALKALYCLIVIIMVIACFLFGWISRRLEFGLAGFLLAFLILFANLRSFTIFFSLIEAPLVLLIYICYLAFCIQVGDKRFEDVRIAFFSGLLIGLAFLSRTDSVFLVLGFGAVLIYRFIFKKISLRQLIETCLSAACGTMLPVGPYLAINYSAFGHFISVSGYRKVRFPDSFNSFIYPIKSFYIYFIPRLALALGISEKFSIVLSGLFLGAVALVVALLFTKTNREKMTKLFATFGDFIIFSIIHFFAVYTFTPGEAFISAWYYVSEILVFSLFVGFLIPKQRLIDWIAIFSFTLALIIQAIIYPNFVRHKTMSWAKLEVAHFIRQNLPSDARLSMYDSGITAYFSRRHFVGLNGLIGDFLLADLLADRRYAEVAAKYKIEYLVLDIDPKKHSYLPGKEVFRGTIKTKFSDFREGEKYFAVYKITPLEMEEIYKIRY